MTLTDLPASAADTDGGAVVRLLSYNIRSMRDDVGALARVIRACAPDVVCVQEAPRFFRWRSHAARLAGMSGLVHVTGGATANGQMILSSLRARVEWAEDVLLPHTPGLHRRGFATAVLRFGDRAGLAVVSCHLSLQKDERRRQADMLLDRLDALTARGELRGGPVGAVAAGDLNERPDGRSFRRLADRLQDGYAVRPWGGGHTSEPARPHQRIDAVLASSSVEVLGCGVPDGLAGVSRADLVAASDHLPVLAALRLPPSR
ncbi:endonuclease/exonuclease/phosphatase family protein [Streptomyces sp. P38-E01]|uniref:Endonuclease/exonuclease/phosphatase family protein n=1 Tax=Streptomyces tardus TaxID=2780544 RepID=A0A949JIY6_9ACTN|nr:endonuclease/exonuclease/phosphatase family protein [Streptomyces tardus]MBU7599519.1 endonuclease/exonuclease/phosphatase family protein [Streptomyces tardus]